MPPIRHVAHMHGMPAADPMWLGRQAEWVPRAVLASQGLTIVNGAPVRTPGIAAEAVQLPPAALAPEPQLRAEVRDGRWAVRCPFCPSAQETSPDDRRFYCVGCLNAAADGRWLKVVWPRNYVDIERVLEARDPRNAHWFPGETLSDLRRENVDHGLPVPD